MRNIITKFNKSFVRLKLWQKDGSVVEITTISRKGVLYLARTKSGHILTGLDREGLDLILSILGELEKEEEASLQFWLEDLAKEDLNDLEVEIDLMGEGPLFKIAYHDGATNSTVYDEFDDMPVFIARNRGYFHPG